MQIIDSKTLNNWFLKKQRPLPWRENPSPYAVWVSEVMLQQTQVSVVVPYFLRWMQLFPSIAALAKAPLENVLKAWEGLGYYSRARRLREGARYLVDHHDAKLPPSAVELARVKGIGPYTVGAILSFAFKQKAVAVDSNVIRVLCRFWGVEESVDRIATRRKIEQALFKQLPEKQPWLMMEALIELGALVCQRNPQCTLCPLQTLCVARKKGQERSLPKKKKRVKTVLLHRLVVVIQRGSKLLLRCGEQGKVMEGLFEFPYLELDQKPTCNTQAMVRPYFPFKIAYQEALAPLSHTFTHFRAFLYPELWVAKEKKDFPGYQWISADELKRKTFSSGHRRILQSLTKIT